MLPNLFDIASVIRLAIVSAYSSVEIIIIIISLDQIGH